MAAFRAIRPEPRPEARWSHCPTGQANNGLRKRAGRGVHPEPTHASGARIGLVVAPGGFTSEAHEAVKRLSGEPYTMVLVKGDDLRVLADGEESVLDWLESLLCRIA